MYSKKASKGSLAFLVRAQMEVHGPWLDRALLHAACAMTIIWGNKAAVNYV
jgi:hypothetical protein